MFHRNDRNGWKQYHAFTNHSSVLSGFTMVWLHILMMFCWYSSLLFWHLSCWWKCHFADWVPICVGEVPFFLGWVPIFADKVEFVAGQVPIFSHFAGSSAMSPGSTWLHSPQSTPAEQHTAQQRQRHRSAKPWHGHIRSLAMGSRPWRRCGCVWNWGIPCYTSNYRHVIGKMMVNHWV